MLHFLVHQFHNEVKNIYKLNTESLLHKLCYRFCHFKENKYEIFNSTYDNNLSYIQDSFKVKKINKLDTKSLLHKLCSRFCCFKENKYEIFNSTY